MAHWTDDYVGNEYVVGQYDCLSLVVDISRNVFNQKIDDTEERADRLPDMSEQIRTRIENYVHPIDAIDAVDGDVLLMKCKGRLNHTGIFTVINNVKYVIHNLRNIKSVAIHRLRDLKKYNMEVEGYYRF